MNLPWAALTRVAEQRDRMMGVLQPVRVGPKGVARKCL